MTAAIHGYTAVRIASVKSVACVWERRGVVRGL
jgi:hypothetical protein